MSKLNSCDKGFVYQTYWGRSVKELYDSELNGFTGELTSSDERLSRVHQNGLHLDIDCFLGLTHVIL